MQEPVVKICFSHSNSILSKLIRWWTKSIVSHCTIVFYDPTYDLDMVLSSERKFVLIPWERWSKMNTIIAEVELKSHPVKSSLKWIIEKYLQTDYDIGAFGLEAIRLKFKRLWSYLKKLKRYKIASPSKLICSESIVRFMHNAGFETLKDVDPEFNNAELVMTKILKGPKKEINILKQPKKQEACLQIFP